MTILSREWSSWIQDVEASLDKALPPADTFPQVLHEAMRYSTLEALDEQFITVAGPRDCQKGSLFFVSPSSWAPLSEFQLVILGF